MLTSRKALGSSVTGDSSRLLAALGSNRRGAAGAGRSGRSTTASAGRDTRSSTGGAGRGTRSSTGSASRGIRGNEAELRLDPINVVGSTSRRVLGLQGSIIRGLRVLVACLRGSGTIGAGDRVLDVVTNKLGTVLAGQSGQLVALGTLGNLDTVLVEPLLKLAIRPGVQKGIGNALLSVGGGRRCRRLGCLHGVRREARVAADRGDELVAGAGLRSGVATLVQPGLQIRLRPRLVEPVTGVGGSLTNLVGGRLVVLACRLEQGVAGARLGAGDTMAVEEGLELRVGPPMDMLDGQQDELGSAHDLRVEDPILDAVVGIGCLILSLIPGRLDGGDQAFLVLLGALLHLLAPRAQVRLKLRRVPAVVGLGDLGVPVLLDQVLQVLAVCGRRVGNVMV